MGIMYLNEVNIFNLLLCVQINPDHPGHAYLESKIKS
jgi:hypothetical protein